MLRVRMFACVLACLMVAPAAYAQRNSGNSNGVPGSVNALAAQLEAIADRLAAIETELETLAGLGSGVDSLGDALSELAGDVSALTTRVADLEAAGGASSPVLWSGGCTTGGSGAPGTYARYCTDHTEFSNADAHVNVPASGVVEVLTAGVYRITYWGVSLGQTGSVRMLVNGQVISSGLNTSTVVTTQRDQSVNVLWPLEAGDAFEIQVLVGSTGSNAYLKWGPPTAPGVGLPAGSRLQIEYVGP